MAAQQQNHKRKYRRWQRDAPMQLWQLDIMGGVFLADGRECKLVTGIDDHSRFVVVATGVTEPSARAVCQAFSAAMTPHGVSSEVLTDNGKQFTGRFTKPYPAEVLFERICRENGITTRLTKPRSPTTTGKIERWHKTLRRELLDAAGPFPDIETAAGRLVKTLPAPLEPLKRAALRGARPATEPLPPPAPPQRAVRRLNQNGRIMVAGQSLRVGRTYAGQTVVIAIEDTVLRVLLNDVELTTHPRTPGLQITILKAYPRRQDA